jgi:hypothetical protein
VVVGEPVSFKAYSIALDAVITARPRPPPSLPPGKASRTLTSPAARTVTPWLNAPP